MSRSQNLSTIEDVVRACDSTLQATLLTRSTSPKPVGFEVSFKVVGGTGVDARARQLVVGTSPKYSITRDALLAILDLCMAVASDPRAFPEVRAPVTALEVESVDGVLPFKRYPVEDWSRPGVDFLSRTPADPDRQALGWYLLAFAYRFVSLHEQGHYLNGHLRLIPDGRFRELGMVRGVNHPTLRAFELESDSFALRNAALFGALRWEEEESPRGTLEICPNKVEWCMLSFVGAGIVGLLLSHLSGESPDSGHPTPACRMLGLLKDVGHVRQRVTESAGLHERLEELWEPAIARAFAAVQAAAHALGGTVSADLYGLIDAHLNEKAHPAKDEYVELVGILHQQEERLGEARAAVAREIGGPIV